MKPVRLSKTMSGFYCRGLIYLSAALMLVSDGRSETAANYRFTHIETGQPIYLHDWVGSVIVLQFFFPSCRDCQYAAIDLKTNLVEYYHTLGGNADGLPVTVAYVNDGGNPLEFAETNGLDLVVDDDIYLSVFHRLWGAGSATIPFFVVINGVTNSTSHAPWAVIDKQRIYETNTTVNALRSTIDRVKGTLRPQVAIDSAIDPLMVEGSFRAQVGRTNLVETSTNWIEWVGLTNLVGSNKVYFRDVIIPARPRRFYRVRVH